MAEVTTIRPSHSRKVQLEQFEPVEHSVEVEVTVGPDEDPVELYAEWARRLEDAVDREIVRRIARLDADSGDD